jgi:hypothetical protein
MPELVPPFPAAGGPAMRDILHRDAAPALPCESNASSVRGTLRAFFRGTRPDAAAGAEAARPAPEPRTREKAWTPPPHPGRAAAHAAFRAVVGGGPRAVDAALAVAEAAARDLRLRCLEQEEALKLLRLYATDDWARSVAARALDRPVRCDDLPGFLHDPAIAAAERAARGARQ